MAGLANIVKNEKNIVTDAYQQIASHNAIYRGKVLVDTTGGSAPYTLSQLQALVSAGNFSDIYVGDEIRVNIDSKLVRFIVMAIDWYIHTGDQQLTSHHLVLVPKNALGIAQMHNTASGNWESGADITTGAYVGSDMFKTNLPKYATKISTALGSHILTWKSLMTNETNASAASSGYSGWQGCSSTQAWTSTNCRLLSEVDVYGSVVWGNAWDVGESNRQLPGFAMNPELLVKGIQEDGRRGWWLCAVTSSVDFAFVGDDGNADYSRASGARGVVPKVLFG